MIFILIHFDLKERIHIYIKYKAQRILIVLKRIIDFDIMRAKPKAQ